MSATSALENEDLENVPLVRMEDVQPARYEDAKVDPDACDNYHDVVIKDELLETCVVDSVGSDCVVNDEDGNVVVTIHAEVFDGDNAEVIVPTKLEPPLNDPLETIEVVVKTEPNTQKPKDISGSWPTLEILPGGVIKHADKYHTDLASLYNTVEKPRETPEEMMYACAKCSESFKYLFCLVKHVKTHEDQQKKGSKSQYDLAKITSASADDCVCLQKNKRKIISKLKSRCKVSKKS